MTEDRDVEVPHEIPSFTAELRRLADALDSGEGYVIEIDGEEITIPADARFSVAHEREDGEVELEFQVSWTLDEADEAGEEEDPDVDEDEDASAMNEAATP
jgi:amphi-Trp domain-containing protein